ncbi:leucine dehydrogenase [Candidatus Aerophobetes bacterium]|uniref:Leucine dehydrogenase n=1 Tax=Aerophobetes bacterium TaxID=2030807 RepID=A0A2A4X0Y5_UNCAE|nr:MAG: leucine dehydrogenase [Candidatus Aerophobetes bacterium]
MTLKSTLIETDGYELVLRMEDASVGLHAIIAIHDTTFGPALGGTRIYPYANEEDALYDVLRLAKGMTYKSAVAKSGFGGGKSVIIADPKTEKTPELLRAFGRAVESLAGKYICAEDVGCTTEDVGIIREETKHVVGLDFPGGSGNPAPFTARGVYRGLQSALYERTGNRSVQGKTIAIQGLGSVGKWLARYLFWEGANLIVTDINSELKNDFVLSVGAKWVEPEEIYAVECDVFAPCAMGGVLTAETVKLIQANIVAGAANNPLKTEEVGEMLHQKGILYAPDFVINAGGLVNVCYEVSASGYSATSSRDTVDQIFSTLMSVYDLAKKNGCSTERAALSLAKRRIAEKQEISTVLI